MNNHIFKKFRRDNRLTQLELGLRLGLEPSVAQTRISHYESGRRELPVSIAYRFIDFANQSGAEFTLEDIFPRPASNAA